jgi:Holliday junction resolvase
MSHPSKQKGNRYEREVVDKAKEYGLDAERAWGSNGKALGYTEDVDCVITYGNGKKLLTQLKRRKAISNYLKPSVNVDAQIFREDRGDSYALIRLNDLLELLALIK